MDFSQQRVRLIVGACALIALIALVISGTSGQEPAAPPLPGVGKPARTGDPFAYVGSRQAVFETRAAAGSAHVLFSKSPGGAPATAARVAGLRRLIDSAARGSGVDPNILEAIVFVESAGRPDVIAGSDPSAAAGLTQILAQTGRSLLGMHVDVAGSRRLTTAIGLAAAQGNTALVSRLQRQRARIDDRFDPSKALAATVRYLRLAAQRFGRADLAVVSYHMGIGNLQQVLDRYDGGHPVPYAQVFFDTAPDRHSEAYRLLTGFGDQSSLYYWRVLGAASIMHLYRSDRSALSRFSALQGASDSSALVLHPPDRTQSFADPGALSAAYTARTLLPLPSNPSHLALAYDRSIGTVARRIGALSGLYRGLRSAALDLLIELAARVRSVARASAPLTVASAVTDRRYQRALGFEDAGATTGFTFQIARRYASPGQATAFQAMLDRLQALNLIAWKRTPSTIEVTVSTDASKVIVDGP